MVLVKKIWLFFLFVVIFAGCAVGPSNLAPNNLTVNPPDKTAHPGNLKTATPPTFPDLRGSRFNILLFTVEDGPYLPLMDAIQAGIEDGVAHFNHSGRVYGAELGLDIVSIPGRTESNIGSILDEIGQRKPLLVLMAAPLTESLYYELNQLDVAILYFAIGDSWLPPTHENSGNVFWLVPPGDVQFSFFVSSVWRNWEQVRPSGIFNQVKIGYLHLAGRPESVSGIPSVMMFLERAGFELILDQPIGNSANQSTTNFLLDNLANGGTVLYLDADPVTLSGFLNDIRSLAAEDVFVIGASIWAVDDLLATRLVNGSTYENLLVPLPFTWWSAPNTQGIDLASVILEENQRGSEYQQIGYLAGLGAADTTIEVLARAIAVQGSEEISGHDLLLEMKNLEDYPVLNDLFTLTYSKGQRAPATLQLWRVSAGGDWVPIGEEINFLELEHNLVKP